MLEYFTYKKVKKHRGQKAEKQRLEKEKGDAAKSHKDEETPSPKPRTSTEEGAPILDQEDEKFLEHLTSSDASAEGDDDDETPPPLPPRIKTPEIDLESDSSSVESRDQGKPPAKGKENDKDKDKDKSKPDGADKAAPKRFSFITRRITRKRKPGQTGTSSSGLSPSHLEVPKQEAHKEKSDIAEVLDDLDLSAQNNKAFSLSKESAEMVRRFTQVLKDIVNGVPTAYGDLVNLIEDRDGILARNYEKLPKSLKKLVAQLPEKLTSTLAPELLAVAAESQGLSSKGGDGDEGGLKGAARRFLTPHNLRELVTKPGAVVGMLKAIVNVLKTRWPAFIGTNVLWSVAVFLLLSVLWYCHKRGRETRLEREASAAADADPVDGSDRIEELPDDPQLPAPPADSRSSGVASPKGKGEGVKSSPLPPPPPIGERARSASKGK
ncbi:hypothetical protein F4779DRAFT_572611 [Xylariaceae sp. FL0662B]|nr:hypothetical protein F4779DRAFT_572611 [Xylariaceae sp. FL0662B]